MDRDVGLRLKLFQIIRDWGELVTALYQQGSKRNLLNICTIIRVQADDRTLYGLISCLHLPIFSGHTISWSKSWVFFNRSWRKHTVLSSWYHSWDKVYWRYSFIFFLILNALWTDLRAVTPPLLVSLS